MRQKPSVEQQPLQLVLLQLEAPPPVPPAPPPDPPPAPLATHFASTHAWVEPHSLHTAARAPHANGWLPGWQSLFLSQHPAQFEGLQAGFSEDPHDRLSAINAPKAKVSSREPKTMRRK